MPNIHSNTNVQGENFPNMFLFTNYILLAGLTVYLASTAIATGSNYCRGE